MGDVGWRQPWYARLWGSQTPSLWWRLGLSPLWLASLGYGALAQGHRASYTWGLRQRHRLPCPVISIGNLTMGGTGKTPLTMWVARWYQQQGWRVAVLSRGYRAHARTAVRVVSTGAGPLCPWQEAGDEPYLLACALPGVAVLIGTQRHRTGRYAYEQLGAEVLILDDGLQHHAVHRDLDIVLIDVSNPFGSGSLVPRGILRESPRALQRADAIVLTRVEMAGTRLPALEQQIRRWAPQQPLYHMRTTLMALQAHDTGAACAPGTLRQQRVVAFAGIGNPQAFYHTLTSLGVEVAAFLVFPDHHPYTRADWQALVGTLYHQRATCLVTTEKDAVRLDPCWHTAVPLFTVRIGVTFTAETPSLAQQLHETMAYATPR